MTMKKLKSKRHDAINQLCNMKPGESIIYSVGNNPGIYGSAIFWLANRGGLALVQRTNLPPSNVPRSFEYIAQRTNQPMTRDEVVAVFKKYVG